MRSKLEIPLVFTEFANTWMITSANVCLLEQCNHHGVDTSVLWHASYLGRPVGGDCCWYWYIHFDFIYVLQD